MASSKKHISGFCKTDINNLENNFFFKIPSVDFLTEPLLNSFTDRILFMAGRSIYEIFSLKKLINTDK